MSIRLYQVDAFTDSVFHGNPAAVCILDDWPAEKLMQQIAMENNLSETAFTVEKNNQFHIRWFTPETEVTLCGHATLATAHVLFTHYHYPHNEILFRSKHRGILTGTEKKGHISPWISPQTESTKQRHPLVLSKASEKNHWRSGKEKQIICSSTKQKTISRLSPRITISSN